ncbi:chaperonin 10-like protein [Lineolata rhizophorae]|uniref:Chaperonin 10-like protein n=1 Tax=Lineolata rhizophorae TaxID=578093 RepID=A0A6A6P3T7_9PEZI|nr:chaperonin 10-like protein [Lineolata rhizophorae]
MMYTFTVFKGSKDGTIIKSTTTKPDLTGDQVYLRITASGICGTDLHVQKADMVLGHEGTGVVEEIGPQVKHLKKGDRIGFGYQHDSCGSCQSCLSGRETFCDQRVWYSEADYDQGSLASHAVWREAFLFKLPAALPDVYAAPLMCAGGTVFNALRMYDIQPTQRVGVVGVGGLGHLAIQFAAKMGCEVIVFSGTDSKKEEAMELGADEFHAVKGKKTLDIGRKLDCLVVTTSNHPDWNLYLQVMNHGSTIFPLYVSEEPLVLPSLKFLQSAIRIQGSVIAARYMHNEMLEFASHHKIHPVTETFPMTVDGITEAMKKLSEGKMRYRAVAFPEAAA